MTDHDTFVAYKRQEIVAVASAILDGNIDLLQGVRRLCALRIFLDNPDDEVFIPLRAIDSETDRLPSEKQREAWATDSLRKLDQEIKEYLSDVENDILDSCRAVLNAYSDR